jgi:hypothetical protein
VYFAKRYLFFIQFSFPLCPVASTFWQPVNDSCLWFFFSFLLRILSQFLDEWQRRHCCLQHSQIALFIFHSIPLLFQYKPHQCVFKALFHSMHCIHSFIHMWHHQHKMRCEVMCSTAKLFIQNFVFFFLLFTFLTLHSMKWELNMLELVPRKKYIYKFILFLCSMEKQKFFFGGISLDVYFFGYLVMNEAMCMNWANTLQRNLLKN